MTVIEIVAVVDPPELVAVIVYEVVPEMTVGVPERTHALERLRPAGSAGLAAHEVIVPPEEVGVCAEIAALRVKVNGVPA